MEQKKVNVITFGTFDLFHYGHVKILQRAKEYGDRLIVGISTDEFNFSKKNRYPIFSFEERSSIVKELKCVDEVFPEESMELKEHYVKKYDADVLIMGDDWSGKFDDLCKEAVYLQRTPGISTTFYIDKIVNEQVHSRRSPPS